MSARSVLRKFLEESSGNTRERRLESGQESESDLIQEELVGLRKIYLKNLWGGNKWLGKSEKNKLTLFSFKNLKMS